jgi:hypothetical protein
VDRRDCGDVVTKDVVGPGVRPRCFWETDREFFTDYVRFVESDDVALENSRQVEHCQKRKKVYHLLNKPSYCVDSPGLAAVPPESTSA